jgi:hypothetical protein
MRSEKRMMQGAIQYTRNRALLPLVRVTLHAGEGWGYADASPIVILMVEPDQVTLYCMDGEVGLEELFQAIPDLRSQLEQVQSTLCEISL